jgi:hypothetical protein
VKNIIPLSLALMAFYSVLTTAATHAVPPDYSENQIIVKFSKLVTDVLQIKIDEDQPLLLYPGLLEPLNQYIFEHSRAGHKRTYVLACYDTAELLSTVTDNGHVDIKVIGRLNSGQQFYGSGFIKILDRQQPHQWQLLKN